MFSRFLSRFFLKKSRRCLQLDDLDIPAYLMTNTFHAVRWNKAVNAVYPLLHFGDFNAPLLCPCIELLTISQGHQMLECIRENRSLTLVVQERAISKPIWTSLTHPNLIDETFTKLRCKAVVQSRMIYDIDVSGGVFRSFELTFKPTDSDLILVLQNDVTLRVMQNYALFRLVDLNMGLLAQIYPSRFIHDILGAGERRNSMNFSPDDCKKYCEHHDNIFIMFADIVGFTMMCKGMQPLEIMNLLTLLYESNDNALKKFPNLSKLEVVGDCYVAVGGLMQKDTANGSTIHETSPEDIANQMLDFAFKIQDISARIGMIPSRNLMLRIGIHCGPVTSGIIGRTSCKFMLFGDAMNTASRMESTCPNGKIQTSEDFHKHISDGPSWTRTTGVQIKGKGEMVTFVYDKKSNPLSCDAPVQNTQYAINQYPYASRPEDENHPSWKANLNLMLPTDEACDSSTSNSYVVGKWP